MSRAVWLLWLLCAADVTLGFERVLFGDEGSLLTPVAPAGDIWYDVGVVDDFCCDL